MESCQNPKLAGGASHDHPIFGSNPLDLDWTCVRVRPRWEKKFARWLEANEMPYFLPLMRRRTESHRKVRWSEVPVFPGYVFVVGRHEKKAFTESGCVAYTLCPRNESQNRRLAEDLLALHQTLASGLSPIPVETWNPGDRVRILDGPLAGATGEIVRENGQGRFIVWIDLLGIGSAIELPDECLAQPIEGGAGR